jgi:hypothetical protein
MMVVGLAFDGTSVRIGRPQALFEGDYLVWGTGNYDVTSDGRQFVMVRRSGYGQPVTGFPRFGCGMPLCD